MDKKVVPDAWDDDWENLADSQQAVPEAPTPKDEVKLSKSERREKHEQANKKLWEAASETPEPLLFLQARDTVPLKSEFKPTVKVLSRRPPPKIASRADPSSAMAGLSMQDNEEDSEEEERRKAQEEFAERQARALREREEKQRRYQEARERILGPSASTPIKESNARAGSPNKPTRGKGKNRGDRDRDRDRDRQASSTDQSPARGANSGRQLYDPEYTPKPNSAYIQKREMRTNSSNSTENQPIRAPRGPDGSGRGGFGFTPRGNRSNQTT